MTISVQKRNCFTIKNDYTKEVFPQESSLRKPIIRESQYHRGTQY